MLFMALFFLAQGMSEDIWLEKEQGTLRRYLATPNRLWQMIAGKVLATVVLIAAMVAIGLCLAVYGFGMNLVNLPAAVVWAALSGALLSLMMLFIQLLAKSQSGGNLITSLVMMPLLIIGGSFFPFESMPDGLAKLGRMTPNGWALVQFKAIIDGSAVFDQVLRTGGGILLVSLILFMICTRRGGAFARRS